MSDEAPKPKKVYPRTPPKPYVPKPKRPKPNKWSEDDLDLEAITKMAAVGLTHEHIAGVLSMSLNTFKRYVKQYDGLRLALENGKARGVHQVANVAFKMAVSGKDRDMTRFFLRTQGGWNDKIGIEHSGQTEMVFSTRIGADGIIRTEENSEVVIDAETIEKLT